MSSIPAKAANRHVLHQTALQIKSPPVSVSAWNHAPPLEFSAPAPHIRRRSPQSRRCPAIRLKQRRMPIFAIPGNHSTFGLCLSPLIRSETAPPKTKTDCPSIATVIAATANAAAVVVEVAALLRGVEPAAGFRQTAFQSSQ